MNTISDNSVSSVDANGNLVITRTVVTQTTFTPDEVQAQLNALSDAITNLQVQQTAVSTNLNTVKLSAVTGTPQ